VLPRVFFTALRLVIDEGRDPLSLLGEIVTVRGEPTVEVRLGLTVFDRAMPGVCRVVVVGRRRLVPTVVFRETLVRDDLLTRDPPDRAKFVVGVADLVRGRTTLARGLGRLLRETAAEPERPPRGTARVAFGLTGLAARARDLETDLTDCRAPSAARPFRTARGPAEALSNGAIITRLNAATARVNLLIGRLVIAEPPLLGPKYG